MKKQILILVALSAPFTGIASAQTLQAAPSVQTQKTVAIQSDSPALNLALPAPMSDQALDNVEGERAKVVKAVIKVITKKVEEKVRKVTDTVTKEVGKIVIYEEAKKAYNDYFGNKNP